MLAVREALGDHGRTPIVVVLDDTAVAETVVASLDGSVHPIVVTQAVARNVVFALRERGLGEVMAELSDFRGADIYVLPAPGLVGTRFGDVVVGALEFRPIGLIRDSGDVELQPAPDEVIGASDRLVMVADASGVAIDLDRETIGQLRARPAAKGGRNSATPLRSTTYSWSAGVVSAGRCSRAGRCRPVATRRSRWCSIRV